MGSLQPVRRMLNEEQLQGTTERLRQIVESALERARRNEGRDTASHSYENTVLELLLPAAASELLRASKRLVDEQVDVCDACLADREVHICRLKEKIHDLEGRARVRETALSQLRTDFEVSKERQKSATSVAHENMLSAEMRRIKAEADLRTEVSSRRWRDRYAQDLTRKLRACMEEIKRLERKPCSSTFSQTSRAEIEARNGGKNPREFLHCTQKAAMRFAQKNSSAHSPLWSLPAANFLSSLTCGKSPHS